MLNSERRDYVSLLIIITAFVFVISVLRLDKGVFFTHAADNLLYEHAGWYIENGAVPYVDFWDPKPPANFVLTTIVSIVLPNNMVIIHTVHILLSISVAGLVAILSGLIIFELTDHQIAGIASTAFILSFPHFHYLPLHGFSPKYYMLFFGLLGIYLALRKEFLSASAATVISAAFWQFGIIFVISVFGIARKSEDGNLYEMISVGGITTGLLLLPLVFLGGLRPMMIEVLFSPFITINQKPMTHRFATMVLRFKYMTPLVLLSSFGILYSFITDRLETWWIFFGASIALIQMIFLDFEGHADMFLGLIYLALGLGLTIPKLNLNIRKIVYANVILTLVISSIWLGGFDVLFRPDPFATDASFEDDPLVEQFFKEIERIITNGNPVESYGSNQDTLPKKYTREYMYHIYWNKLKPDTCHYRVGGMHRMWVEQTSAELTDTKCGQQSWGEIFSLI